MDNHKAWSKGAILLQRARWTPPQLGSIHLHSLYGLREGNNIWDRPKHEPGKSLIWILAAHLISSAITFRSRLICGTNFWLEYQFIDDTKINFLGPMIPKLPLFVILAIFGGGHNGCQVMWIMCALWHVRWKPGFWICIQISLWLFMNECIHNMIVIVASICSVSMPFFYKHIRLSHYEPDVKTVWNFATNLHIDSPNLKWIPLSQYWSHRYKIFVCILLWILFM